MKKQGIAKITTLAILIASWAVASVGAWFPAFNMEGYQGFILAFAPMYVGLIASIGINSYKEKKSVYGTDTEQ